MCPYHGIYQFTLNFNTYGNDGLELGIFKRTSEETKGLVRAFGDWSNSKTTGSATVIAKCGPSEVVWVEASGNKGQFEGDSQRRTHFTGYLLYAY